MRIDVFGPGQTVIMHEDHTVVIHPDEPFYYEIEVPAYLGEPEGLRVGLDDPILEDLQTIISAARTLASTAKFEITKLYVRAYADILRQNLFEAKYDFSSGEFEFKTPFWDNITNHPWRTLVEMAEAAGEDITLFKIRWGSLAWDVFTGKFFNRGKDELIELLQQILNGLSIRLGGLTIGVGAEVKASLTADPTMHCPDPEDIEKAKQNLQRLALLLNSEVAGEAFSISTRPKWRIPIAGWVAISVGSFGAAGGTSFDYKAPFTIELSGYVELTLEASVVLNPFSMFELLREVVSLIGGGQSSEEFFQKNQDKLQTLGWFTLGKFILQGATTIKRWNFYYNMIQNVMDQINLYGDCDPDPPDPRPPDDRQDVWQGVENFYQGETHAATIDNLSQLIQRAQTLGLWRAERLLTLRLREAELSRFLDDNEAYVDYMVDSLSAYANSDYEVLNIITGTTQLTSTEAISEAILLLLDERDTELATMPYVLEQDLLENQLQVAEQNFQALTGQELELQQELRQLFTADSVGIIASGFAEATQSALAAMGLPSQLISPWPGNGTFRGQPAPYLAPGLAPRVVVVSSGGLHAVATSTEARDWLDAYVSGGGLLIVFTQAFGSDWTALPGGQVAGVGYEEDRRWQHATVEATQPSDWLVWMGISKPDIQIDGAFTAWPANANVLLKRTFGDYAGYPVLLEYTHGNGTVLATSAYGDWAWQTNFWWGDDARFTHSILIRGYLLARGQDVGDVFAGDPATSVNVSFLLTNIATYDATQVKLQIPLVWGTGSNSSVATVPLNLAAGDTTLVTATIPTPPTRRGVHDWTQVGLYRVKLTVTGSNGQQYNVWGPFVYVRSPIVPPAVAGTLQVAQSPVSLFGTAVLTASVRNYTNVARTVTISNTKDLPTATVTLNVPANSTAQHVYTLFMDGSKAPGVTFYDEANDVIGLANLSIQVAYPNLKATPILPAALANGSTIPVVVTNQAQQGQALAATLAMTLTAPSGATVWTESQPLPTLAAGGVVTPNFTLSLPGLELGTYQLVYRVDDGRNLARTSTVPIPSQLVLDATFDRATYRIRETGTLAVEVQNAGKFDLTATVSVSSPDLGLSNSQPITLPVGSSLSFVHPFTVPASLDNGPHEVIVSYQVGSQTVNRTLLLQIPQSRVLSNMAQTAYMAGDGANIQLSNTGGVDAPLTATLRLVDVYGTAIATDTVSVTVLAGQLSTVTLTIPAGAITGDYYIEMNGRNTDTDVPLKLERHLDITGVSGELTVYTGQPNYFSDEQIDTFTDILMSSSSLTDGELNLRICSANSDDGAVSTLPPKVNYTNQTVPFNWIDIASGGAVVARGTNVSTLVNLGFSFQYYGNTYTQMYVHSNGFVSFGSSTTSNSNTAIPNVSTPNNAIYALWDYLYPIGGVYGSVYAQQLDANRYAVQWQSVSHCCGTGAPETFQIILDNTDNSITLQYLDITDTSSATVGVENLLGTAAVQISNFQTGIITDNTALKLAPNQIEVEQTVYTSAATPINWIDIASGGAVVAQGDNTNTLVNIGFPFQFYGTSYTQMYVGSNGYVTFGSGSTTSSNISIPSTSSPNNAIYALWDDLYPVGGVYGNVYLKQIDATHTVVQWERVGHCCSNSSPETFQIILDGSDNSVTLQYLDVSSTGSATVGVENSTGAVGVQLVYNQAGIINDNMAFKLTPGLVTIPDTNYTSAAATYNWIDIAPTGDLVAFGNDTNSFVELGFDFEFYGSLYNYVYVDSNGFISFNYTYGNPYNSPIPSPYDPNNAVYGLWDDLYPVGGAYGAVFAQQVSPTRYVFQWQDVAHCCGTGASETFQIILDGSDNSVTLQYEDVSDTSSATAGVENWDGSNGVDITSIITDNLAIRFATITQTVTQTGYISNSLPLNWHDISATGVITAVGDDTYSMVDIGFPFQFYGITYTEMFVSSNGYVSFGDGYSSYSTEYIPTPNAPNNAIYAFWTDLYPAGPPNGNIYTEQISPTVHVIQWEAVSHCCNPGEPETFQIVLDGSNNSVTLQYLDVTNQYSALAGVENADGTLGTLAAYGDPQVITDGVAIQLTPVELAVEVSSYVTTTVPFVWENIGPGENTNILIGSGTYMPVSLGFPFQFYGITQTQMYVGSNGFVSFEDGYTNSSNGSLPSSGTPNNAIYALWDSLYPVGEDYGQIYARQTGPAQYVVQWQGVTHCCSIGTPETFQIVLDGTDNSIILQYEDVTLTNSATVGVENRQGNRATQIAYNQSGVINDGSAFKLTPNTQYLQVSSYLVSSVTPAWQEIAPPDDTAVFATSNSYTLVNLGFPFVFYGITQTQMYVGSNGFVSFEGGYTHSSNGSLPSTATPNHAIYALWDSLYPIGGANGQIYMRQTGPTQYVVQWEAVSHCCTTGSPETFQIVLDGSDNTVTLQYEDVTLTNSATTGVEDRYGVNATQLAYNQSGIIVDGTAWKLTPNQQMVLQPSYAVTPVTLTWQEIAPPSGTSVVAVGSNTYEQVNLGFPFEFYGQEYTSLFVGSNGLLSFGSGQTANANTSLPNFNTPNNSIYALWDYLYPIGGDYGSIYARQIDTNRYVVQWQGVAHCCSLGSPETFQVILDGSDNTITLQYEDVSLTNSATVGVENDFGGRALQIAYNQSGVIVDNLAYRLTPVEEEVPPPPVCDPTQPQPIDLMLVIDRSGSMGGQPIIDARNAAKAFVDFLDLANDRVGLASFSTSATLDHVLTHDGESVKARIDTLIASGSTAIGEGIAVAHTQILANTQPGVPPVMVVLSDGFNNAGRDPITAANAAKNDNIRIVTIGLGSGADENLLKAIATTESDYHFAPSSADLQTIFESIANSICRSPLPYDASCGGYVLWEETLPVDVVGSLNVTEIAGPLDVTGRLTLDGRLYAETGQPLAQDQYPFYLHDRDTALTLETDRPVYRPGDTVVASGYVTNTSTLTVTTDLEVWGGETLLLSQPLLLAPGQGYAYTAALTNTANFTNTTITFVAIANGVSVYRPVVVATPEVAGALLAPNVVSRDPFSATLVLTNTGLVTASLQPTLNAEPKAGFVFDSGNVVVINGTVHTLQDMVLTANVSGDATQTFSQPIIQGELATLTLLQPVTDLAGPIEISYQVAGTGLLPADGFVTLEVNGQELATQPFAVLAGQTVTGTMAVVLPAGNHVVNGRIYDQYGPFDTDAMDVSLITPAVPSVAEVEVIGISIPGGAAAAGGTVDVVVELTNSGAAEPIVIGLQLFGPEEQWIVTPPAYASQTYTFTLQVPADIPADEYFGEATVDGEKLPFIVAVTGIDIQMSLALDQPFYQPGELATLTVTLTDTAGLTGDYLVMPRYLTAEDYYTVTIPANQTVQYTFSFTATEPARVNVFLATTGAPPEFERRVLMLDSLPVQVLQPELGATISFDKLVYNPGDTVYMTVNVTGTLSNVFIMGPVERTDSEEFLIWNAPVNLEGLGFVLTGTHTLSTTLPTVMKEGRYTFLGGINGEIYPYPIDVNGYKVTTRHIEIDKTRYAQEDTITAVAEFWNEGDAPITGLELQAWIITPDENGVLPLTPPVSRTVDLQPGLNVITVTGQFTTPVVGAHRILVNLTVPGETWRLAGAVAQFNVGWANLVELNTDKGDYAPGEPGTGRLDVYGYGPTDLTVTLANDSSVLFNQQVDLAGFATFTFPVPTAVVDGYLLVAQSVDQGGNTDELTHVYAVPAPADVAPPQITLDQPFTHTVITTSALSTTFTIAGQVNDDSGTAVIIINGEVFTPTANGEFVATVEVLQGYNIIVVTVVDESGNFISLPTIFVLVAPQHGVTLTADRTTAQVGEVITFQFVLTASSTISDVYASQVLPGALVEDVQIVSVSSGTADIVSDTVDYALSWYGDLTAPVIVTLAATAKETGLLTQAVNTYWGYGLTETSNQVQVDITNVIASCDLYPIALHVDTLNGAQPGTTLPDMFNGPQPGNFGWLTWSGEIGAPLLVASLTPPGDSYTYVNPFDPTDHVVSVGDWVQGKPGVTNARQIRDALNLLKTLDIVVPIWDATQGNGNHVKYHVSGFAIVRLLDYSLPGQNRITARFIGYTTCGTGGMALPSAPPTFTDGFVTENPAAASETVNEATTPTEGNNLLMVPLPPAGTRVTTDLQALYTFQEGSGNIVHDVSGVGTPLNLTINDSGAVTWLPGGGLSLNTPTAIGSGVAATKLINSAEGTRELTVEAWIKPMTTTQDGPASIVSLANGPDNRNMTLGQMGDTYDWRLRTGITSKNGMPWLNTPDNSVAVTLTHIVYTRDIAGFVRIYLNGIEVSGNFTATGNLTWDEMYPLVLGNDVNGENPWLGQLYLVAFYNRALSPAEVSHNFGLTNSSWQASGESGYLVAASPWVEAPKRHLFRVTWNASSHSPHIHYARVV